MNSLFVISLPRSLSSMTYYVARMALRLKAPSWTSDGEILNIDRYALYPGPSNDMSLKFIVKEHDPGRFKCTLDFLGQATVPEGFAYKDVVHPFVVSEWLKSSGFRVLRIKRNLTDVAFSMLARKWYYPKRAAQEQEDMVDSVIEGLIRADRALDEVAGEHIVFEEIVSDEKNLREALIRLYPGVDVMEFQYLQEKFCAARDQVLQRRTLDLYKKLDEKVSELTEATS